MIANDDPFQLLVVCNSLKNMKDIAKIDQATNGQEALDIVMQNEIEYAQGKGRRHYDMIFMDLGMPIIDGYEACELIIQHYRMLSRST